jgi:sugar/nucleoside kinase (ribokinase family)
LQPDLVGIGAINYDYVFRHSRRDKAENERLEGGDEDLAQEPEMLVAQILRRGTGDIISQQIGGSAFLAVKTVALSDMGVSTGFVGLLADPGCLEELTKLGGAVADCTSHLSDDSWVFRSAGVPSRALISIRRGKRYRIDVAAGDAASLVQRITDKEEEVRGAAALTGEAVVPEYSPLTNYLAGAKWVHMSSFADPKQFSFFVDRVARAKKINRSLKFSIDPGDAYTRHHHSVLKEAFDIADIVFVSEREYQNLVASAKTRDARSQSIESLLATSAELLIVKSKAHHTAMNLWRGELRSRTFWHPRLAGIRVRNDTGAGDVFAGGVLAGLLSPALLTYQPAPIRLGALLASERLKSVDFPARQFAQAANGHLAARQRKERLNYLQRILVFGEKWGALGLGFIIGVAASVVAGVVLKALLR